VTQAESKDTQRTAETMAALTRMMDQGRSFSSHEKNCAFLNTGDDRFATISALSTFDFPDDDRALALVDWDQDGYPDVWLSARSAPRLRFLRNETPHAHHYLSLQLRGNGTTTNRDAIGARVEIVVKGLNGKRMIKSLRAGEGFLAQSSKTLLFGLGQLTDIEKVKVHWPAGNVEEFTGLSADRRYVLTQGTSKVQELPKVDRQLVLAASEQKPIPYTGITVPLTTHLPMPRSLTYPDFTGATRKLPIGNGKPTLIILWASWCEPCQKELIEFTGREKDLRAAGLNVFALASDGLGEDDSTPAAAAEFCKARIIPFETGRATAYLAQLLTAYHHQLVCLTRPLPVPSSFLIDGTGRLTTIYKGRVSVDQVLADVLRTPKTVRERWEAAACLPGKMIDHDGLYHSLKLSGVSVSFSMAETLSRNPQATPSDLELALEHYRSAVELQADFAEAQQGLAMTLDRLGRRDEALKHYQEALKQYPDRAVLHYYVGNLHALEKRFVEALTHLRKAVQLDPKLAPAQDSLKRVETIMRDGNK
jgi:tetratricopeptide (TPR) repeat protein